MVCLNMVILVLLLSLQLLKCTLQKAHCGTSLSIWTKKTYTLFSMTFSNYFRNFLSVITDESGEQLMCGKAYRILTSMEMVITFSSVADDQKGFLLLFEGSYAFYLEHLQNMFNSYGSFVKGLHLKRIFENKRLIRPVFTPAIKLHVDESRSPYYRLAETPSLKFDTIMHP